MKFVFVLIPLGLSLFSPVASARVFDINKEKFAPYFSAQYGPTSVGKAGFEKASPFSETYDKGLTTIYGGEFGFIYSTQKLNFRFAFEILKPPTTVVTASNAAGTALYTLNSDISVVSPKIGIEFNVKQWTNSRIFVNADYGQGNLSLNNSYVFTSAGTTATGKSDYTEEGRSTASLLEGSIGWEFLMFDTTTMVLGAGYRNLSFAKLTHNRDASTLQGAKVKGDPMQNTDGSERTINLTGYFATVAFRFWVF